MTLLRFDIPAMVEGQPMFATAPGSGPDGEAISVIVLTFGRARIVRHHGYTPSDWDPMEGW